MHYVHYRKQTNVPRSKIEEHMFMPEEHKTTWTSGPRNISYVPRQHGTEELMFLGSPRNIIEEYKNLFF
jgi:hypothetical protein